MTTTTTHRAAASSSWRLWSRPTPTRFSFGALTVWGLRAISRPAAATDRTLAADHSLSASRAENLQLAASDLLAAQLLEMGFRSPFQQAILRVGERHFRADLHLALFFQVK